MPEEEKFKLSLLNIEKRILDLETMIGELAEKIKQIDLTKLNEKIEELDDLIMISNLGLVDLKKKIEERKLSEEEFERLVSEIKPEISSKIEIKIKEVENEISNLKEKIKPEEIKEIKEKTTSLETETSTISKTLEDMKYSTSTLNEDIEKIRKKMVSIEEKDMKKMVSEISLLRNEFSREMREMMEKIESIEGKTSGIDLALLASKFNSLKESVDYLLNRKVELDMKVKTLEEAFSRILGREVIPEKLFGSLENFAERISNLENKMKLLESSVLAAKPSLIDEKINELLSKISILEGKIFALETSLKKSPVIIE